MKARLRSSKRESPIANCKLQSFVSAEETQRQVELLAQRQADHAKLMKEWEELSSVLEPEALSLF